MFLSPQNLLSMINRERCVASFKELPSFTNKDTQTKGNASVLVPMCVYNGEVCLLYTVRSTNLKNHSGEISFPGGKADENESNIKTALRETEEEIGVCRDEVDVWGEMSEVQGRQKELIITPVVGEIRNFDPNKLQANTHEVDEIFTVPMTAFCNTDNHGHFEFNKQPLPLFLYEKHKIWGITGMITHLFLQCFLPSDVYKVDFLRRKFEIDELMPSKL